MHSLQPQVTPSPAPVPSSRYTSHSTFGQPLQNSQSATPEQLQQDVSHPQYQSAQFQSVSQSQSVSGATLPAGETKLDASMNEGSSYPNTPDRLNRAPPAASPDYTTTQGSVQSSATPSDAEGKETLCICITGTALLLTYVEEVTHLEQCHLSGHPVFCKTAFDPVVFNYTSSVCYRVCIGPHNLHRTKSGVTLLYAGK